MIALMAIYLIIWGLACVLITPIALFGWSWHLSIILVNGGVVVGLWTVFDEEFEFWWEENERSFVFKLLTIFSLVLNAGYTYAWPLFLALQFEKGFYWLSVPASGLTLLHFWGLMKFGDWFDKRLKAHKGKIWTMWTMRKFVFLYRLGFAVALVFIFLIKEEIVKQDIISKYFFWFGLVQMGTLWLVGRKVVINNIRHLEEIAVDILRAGYIYTLFGVVAAFITLYLQDFDLKNPVTLLGPLGLAVVTSIIGVIASGEIKRYDRAKTASGKAFDGSTASFESGDFSDLCKARTELIRIHLALLKEEYILAEKVMEECRHASNLLTKTFSDTLSHTQEIANTSKIISAELSKFPPSLQEAHQVLSQAKKLYEAIAKLFELDLFRDKGEEKGSGKSFHEWR